MRLRGMPPPEPTFVNRRRVFAEIGAVLAAATAERRCAYVHLHGLSGIGKSQLTHQLAREFAAEFPDGDCYVDLGAVGVANRPAEYLRKLLVGLGVPPRELTDDLDELTSLLRARVAGRRLLLVLDDVVGPQIAERLWFDAPGSLVVLVTSDRWSRLPTGYESVGIEPLTVADATDMVHRRLNQRRRSCPAAVIDALVHGTGGVPELIAVGTDTVASIPTASDDEIIEMFTALFEVERDAFYERFYGVVYERLSSSAQEAYRWLSLHHILSFPIGVAAALLGKSIAEAAPILKELYDRSLLSEDGGHYRFHYSVWQDAVTRRQIHDDEQVWAAATDRMLSSYIGKAVSYELVLSGRWRVAEIFREQPAACELTDRAACVATRAEGLLWLERNRKALCLMVTLAVQRNRPDLATAFCEAMWSLLHLHNHTDDWSTTHHEAIEAARRAGRHLDVLHLALQLAALHVRLKAFARAEEYVDLAEEIAVRWDHVFGRQSSLEWRARIRREERKFVEAERLYLASLDVAVHRLVDAQERLRAVAMVHFHIGRLYRDWPERASQVVAELTAAADFFRQGNDLDNYANVLLELGQALDPSQALPRLMEALGIFEADRSVDSQKRALRLLITVLSDQAPAADYRRRLAELEGGSAS